MQANRQATQFRMHSSQGIPLCTGLLLLLVQASACGGGGGGTTISPPPPAPQPNFSISLNPTGVAVLPGTSTAIQVTVTPLNGFNASVTVTLNGVPLGVTPDPASPFTMQPGTQSVTLTVAPSVPFNTYPITFQAVSGNLTHSATANLQVAPLAEFFLQLSPTIVAVPFGQTSQISIISSVGGGVQDYQLQLSVSGLPTGTTGTFASNPIAPGTSTSLNISADANAPTSTSINVTVTATRVQDSLQKSAQFQLNVTPPPGTLPANRAAFVRTDALPLSGVYDPAHQLFFASVPDLSQVVVVSPATGERVATIPVPAPWGIDLSLDAQRVLVGTRTQMVFEIDTSTLQIVRRTVFPKVVSAVGQPEFVVPERPFITSNGTVLFIARAPFVGGEIIQWDPASGTAIRRPEAGIGEGFVGARSLDGSKVLFSDLTTGGTLVVYDSDSDQFTSKTLSPGNFAFAPAVNPTGTQFAVAVTQVGFVLLDSQLNVIGTVAGPVGGLTTGQLFSLDGSLLYIVSQPGGTPLISTVNTQTLQVVATAPSLATGIPYISRFPPLKVETPLAVDETGLLLGAGDHGLVLDDSTNVWDILLSLSSPAHTILVEPQEGPLNVQTPTTIRTDAYNLLPDVWFGEQRSPNVVHDNGIVRPTAPSSSVSGPVDVKIVQPNGLLSFIAEGFTYGLDVTPIGAWAADPDGGTLVDIFGYGFTADLQGSQISVAVGGQQASIASRGIYPAEVSTASFPFPLHHLQVTVPAGTPGPKDLTVSASSGSETVPGGFHYLAAVDNYPLAATPNRLLYDPTRQRLYVNVGDHLEVLSLTTNAFLAPISPPTLSGSRQLRGMALTPDGSRLLVANFADDSVAIIDPDDPASAVAAPVVPTPVGVDPQCNPGPDRIASTSTGKAFISAADNASLGCSVRGLLELDLVTLAVAPRTEDPLFGLIASSVFLTGSKNGEAAFVANPSHDGGDVFLWDSATDTWGFRRVGGQPRDGQTAGDGNLSAVTTFGNVLSDRIKLIDNNLNLVGELRASSILPFGGDRRAGLKFHDSGSLLYSPFPNGVDIFDVGHGDLRQRISLVQEVPIGSDVMALDDTGRFVFLATTMSLTVVELDAITLSLGSVSPPAGPAGLANLLTIRGSGFQPGADVTIGGVPATPVVFVDSSTLLVTTPALPTGGHRIIITNPDGSSYALDAAYSAE